MRRFLYATDEARAELFVLALPSVRALSHDGVGALRRLYVACASCASAHCPSRGAWV